MDPRPASTEELLQVVSLLQDTKAEVKSLRWEVAKLTFYVAVLQRVHPDEHLRDRAAAAVAHAELNQYQSEAIRELLSTSVDDVLREQE